MVFEYAALGCHEFHGLVRVCVQVVVHLVGSEHSKGVAFLCFFRLQIVKVDDHPVALVGRHLFKRELVWRYPQRVLLHVFVHF